jgi:phospholipid/cholesterol/gamma-HCH transport system ATP-binding protein
VATSALELDRVSVSFGRETFLRDVSLSIESGESLVLIGPSGAGKSILLKLFGGLIKPSKGRVLLDGQDLAAMSEKERNDQILKMGMLFQKNALFDSLKVGENLAFPLEETTALSPTEIDQRVNQFLKAVGLEHAKDLYPDEISGGMQKRVGIARALALQPKTILYDDPTAGLDPITSRKIVELILDLQAKNKSTLVAVTNDMARAFQLGDRLAMVVDKGVIVTGTKQETLKNKDPRVHQFVRGELDGPLTDNS